MSFQIAPSLLACDFSRLGEEIRAVEKAGADVLHLDIMDGHFVPNITFGMPIIEKIRPLTKLPLDAHLMITDADKYIEAFKDVGCDWISVHVEACPHLNRTLNQIRKLGMKAGIAINPGTSLAMLEGALSEADYVLIMSVNPGFGGQGFIDQSLDRVRQLKRQLTEKTTKIQIDGGIKESNIRRVVDAGADILVIGTGLFAAPDYQAQIKKLRAAALAVA